jgi:hypothetical protein
MELLGVVVCREQSLCAAMSGELLRFVVCVCVAFVYCGEPAGLYELVVDLCDV